MANTRLTRQVNEYIASTVEGYLNGCYDCGEEGGYTPMTVEEWIDYVFGSLEMDKDIIVNGEEFKHLYFYGKDNIAKLVRKYLDTYEDVQPYVIR